MAFGVGATGEAVYLGLFNTFITIYYNQVMELNNALIGIAIMLAMIGDAISDPVVGIISDRWRSKLGRRHPFLWLAPVPLTLTLYCVFNPPEFLLGESSEFGQWGLFAWLAVWTIFEPLVTNAVQRAAYGAGGRAVKKPAPAFAAFQRKHRFCLCSRRFLRFCGVELFLRR